MPSYLMHNHWMVWTLDNCDVRALTLGYKITDNDADPWTKRFNDFKANDPRAIRGAIATMETAVQSIKLKAEKILLVSAISSSDTVLRANSGLYQLGEKIASARGWRWDPTILSKKAHQRLHGLPSGPERDAAVAGAYSAKSPGGTVIEENFVVVLDDFQTRGSTLRDIARALRDQKPNVGIVGLALGKTERLSWQPTISNAHIPSAFAALWDKA